MKMGVLKENFRDIGEVVAVNDPFRGYAEDTPEQPLVVPVLLGSM